VTLRVDNVPAWLQPLFLIYGWGCGSLLYLLFFLLHHSVRIRISGDERLEPGAAYVYCQWHGYTFPHMIGGLYRYRGLKIINHPAWYMKPIHVVFHFMGFGRMILGSTGHGGREAANRLVGYLRQGRSTLMFPDGPDGPPFTFHKGTLHVAMQSGCPIVPVRIRCRRKVTLPTWDDKHLPLPFSVLEIEYGKPLSVTQENFDEMARAVPEAMTP
jgi:lysophospholipid acyltransferase (LPLAT)-like uncharacterized protein